MIYTQTKKKKKNHIQTQSLLSDILKSKEKQQ